MSLPVTVSFANPDPNICPANVTALVTYLNTLLTATVTGTYVPYVIGSATPGVDDQDKIWLRLDGGGRPLGFYKYYGGSWRKAYTGLPGEMRLFNGDPALHFEVSGLGTSGGLWDGWAIANGANGTVNLSDRFIVIGKQDTLGVGYTGGAWKTNLPAGGPAATGGTRDITLDATNTYSPGIAEVTAGHWKADGNAANAGSGLYGLPSITSTFSLVPAVAGNPTPPAIPTLPTFYALAIIQWIGYA